MTYLTRRRLLAVAGGSFLAAGTVRPSVVRSTQRFDGATAAWPGPHGGARGTAAVPSATPTDVTVAWEREYQAPSIYAVPIALGAGTLSVGDREALGALESATGGERWSYALPHPFSQSRLELGGSLRNSVRLPPWIADDRVVAVFDTNICALSRSSGRLQWRVRTNTAIDSLLVTGNTAIFDARRSGTEALWALDTETGAERWRYTDDGDHRMAIGAIDDRLYTVRTDAGWVVAAHDLATGAVEWRRTPEFEGRALSPRPRGAVTEDGLYVGGGSLVAFDHDGTERWRGSFGTAFGRAFAVAHETVYAVDDEAGEVVALEAATGDRRWSTGVSNPARPGGVSADAETVYVSTTDGFRALAAESGDERFRFDEAPTASASGPVIPTAERLYQSVGDRVYALEGAGETVGDGEEGTRV
ncbi:outer membrane protein assembly factor BamB family protein [Natronobiforma cellulositropha]|uniref:outer membrane protein assembly factor BamB family protein n=1 Tax=Natronobiforma cellulositropha TaxID=1679076 RepID=UPI0021D5D944|nr:PQQ-binding-like beta-propeller repeat protein [Natronobiforma cellulositropha]